MTTKFLKYPFAISGDRTTVPDTTQGDGSLSYQQGYGPDYSGDPATDPDALNIERTKFNEVMYDVTTALRQYQTNGVPNFITSSDNGGTAFSYDQYAQVLYDPGSGAQPYTSLVASNTALPTDATKWSVYGTAAAGLLTGTTLASNVVTSSLVNFGGSGSATWNFVKSNSGASSFLEILNNNTAASTVAAVVVATGTSNAFSNFSQNDGSTPFLSISVGAGNTGGIFIDSSAVSTGQTTIKSGTGGINMLGTVIINSGRNVPTSNPDLLISNTASGGANLKFTGNGGTTPSKYIRANSGNLQILNDAYTALMTIDDAGDVTFAGSITATTGLSGTSGTFSGIISNTLPITIGPTLDSGGASFSLAGSTAVALPTGSGLLIISNGTTGDTAIFMLGGGAVTLISQTIGTGFVASASPSTSQIGVFFSSTYQIKNGTTSAVTLFASFIRTRPAN